MAVATAWLIIFFGAIVLAGVIQWKELRAMSAQGRPAQVPSSTYRKGFWLGLGLVILVYVVGLFGFMTGAPWLGAASLLAVALLVALITAMRDDGWEFLRGAVTGTVGTFLTFVFGTSVFFFILTVG